MLGIAATALLLTACGETADTEPSSLDTEASEAETTPTTPVPDETDADPTEPPDSVTPPESPSPTPPEQSSPGDEEDESMDPSAAPSREPGTSLADDAVADLAGRLQVPATAIDVLQAEQVTWPDGSLGCPKPGEFYTQAQVDGYRVVLQHDSRVFLYHAGGDGPVFLCKSDEKDGGYDFVPPPGIHG